MNKTVTLYTDGACSGNPGPGGWACVLVYKGTEKELSGGEPETTNNRMEITAVIEGLKALKEPCAVDLYTDSKYVLEGATKWLAGWQEKGWKKAFNCSFSMPIKVSSELQPSKALSAIVKLTSSPLVRTWK